MAPTYTRPLLLFMPGTSSRWKWTESSDSLQQNTVWLGSLFTHSLVREKDDGSISICRSVLWPLQPFRAYPSGDVTKPYRLCAVAYRLGRDSKLGALRCIMIAFLLQDLVEFMAYGFIVCVVSAHGENKCSSARRTGRKLNLLKTNT